MSTRTNFQRQKIIFVPVKSILFTEQSKICIDTFPKNGCNFLTPPYIIRKGKTCSFQLWNEI